MGICLPGEYNKQIEYILTKNIKPLILYIRESKDSIKRLLEPMREFSRATGYKMNVQKSMLLVNSNNSMAEKGLVSTAANIGEEY